MVRVIEDEILFEIADEIRRLRRTCTPEQRSHLCKNITIKFIESDGRLPKYLEIVYDQASRVNIYYHREFWKRAGIKFDSIARQDKIDLIVAVASYCSQHPTSE